MNLILAILDLIQKIEKFYWEYIGVSLVIIIGLYLTKRSNFFQVKAIFKIKEYVTKILNEAKENKRGIHPIQLIFASTGGMIGIGNVVGVSSAVLIGGPGAIFWLWIGAFLGMIIKYCEIFLALKTRIQNSQNSYDGGIMFYVNLAFKNKFITAITAAALLIYTVEIYQFTVIVDTIQSNFENLDRNLIVLILLCLVLYSTIGGIKRLANICSIMMPIFILGYMIIGIWIIVQNIDSLFAIIKLIFSSAFNGQSAIGGFVGSTFIYTAYNGISRAVYAGDIGIGYDSIVQSETSTKNPQNQAIIAIYCLGLNVLICTISMFLVLTTNSWQKSFTYHSDAIPMIFADSLMFGKYFMGIVLFLAGFTTVISFLTIGFKVAKFISHKWGKAFYFVYAFLSLYIFSFTPQEKLALLMSLCAGILVTINLCAIIKLRKEIKFD